MSNNPNAPPRITIDLSSDSAPSTPSNRAPDPAHAQDGRSRQTSKRKRPVNFVVLDISSDESEGQGTPHDNVDDREPPQSLRAQNRSAPKSRFTAGDLPSDPVQEGLATGQLAKKPLEKVDGVRNRSRGSASTISALGDPPRDSERLQHAQEDRPPLPKSATITISPVRTRTFHVGGAMYRTADDGQHTTISEVAPPSSCQSMHRIALTNKIRPAPISAPTAIGRSVESAVPHTPLLEQRSPIRRTSSTSTPRGDGSNSSTYVLAPGSGGKRAGGHIHSKALGRYKHGGDTASEHRRSTRYQCYINETGDGMYVLDTAQVPPEIVTARSATGDLSLEMLFELPAAIMEVNDKTTEDAESNAERLLPAQRSSSPPKIDTQNPHASIAPEFPIFTANTPDRPANTERADFIRRSRLGRVVDEAVNRSKASGNVVLALALERLYSDSEFVTHLVDVLDAAMAATPTEEDVNAFLTHLRIARSAIPMAPEHQEPTRETGEGQHDSVCDTE